MASPEVLAMDLELRTETENSSVLWDKINRKGTDFCFQDMAYVGKRSVLTGGAPLLASLYCVDLAL
jgi:hypothetical protein